MLSASRKPTCACVQAWLVRYTCPYRIKLLSRSRSSSLSVTIYFFTAICFAVTKSSPSMPKHQFRDAHTCGGLGGAGSHHTSIQARHGGLRLAVAVMGTSQLGTQLSNGPGSRVGASVAALVAGWLAGCATAPLDAPVPYGEATIYIVGRGWHTDIGLSVSEVPGPLASLERDFPGVRFMVFGFGEREYYMGRNEGAGEMLAALFPSKSAILLTPLHASPSEAFANQQVVTLQLPKSGVQQIAKQIWDDLEKTADGLPARLGDGPDVGSVFYASSETYSAFHTCNTWTALLLSDAGLPMNTRVLLANEVLQQVARIAAKQRQTK